ncbi:MAG: hypothetical protein AAF512_14240 [Pseudomonadota bacterium]
MKTFTFQAPDDIAERLEKLIASQGDDYASVNTDDVKGSEALILDLVMMGLDELTDDE